MARLRRSLRAAFAGLAHVSRTQRNWPIHLALGCIAVGMGLALGLAPAEWGLLAVTIGLVLALEAMNTAVEATVDAVGGPQTPTTRQAKDSAAAAVLIGAIAAIAVGAAIFAPRLFALWA